MKRAAVRRRDLLLFLGLAWSLVGCGSRDNWFPMKVGQHWTYQVRTAFDVNVQPIKVLRPLPVASAPGYELTGPLGVSRIAWRNGTLYADSTVNAQFIPPLPLLVPAVERTKDDDKKVLTWHGRVIVLGKERPGSATLYERNATIEFGTRKVPTILSTLDIRIPGGKIGLQSWYQQGVGLIRQEQRTNGTRVVQLQMLGHGD